LGYRKMPQGMYLESVHKLAFFEQL
jgi:hypothetical protein